VVFDSAAKLPLDSKLVADVEVAPVTLVAGRSAERATLDALKASGVDVMIATGENEAARVTSALAQLGESGVTSLLLEGGPRLAGAFLDSGEIDELRAFIAPVLIGARTARDPFEGAGADLVSDAVKLPALAVERVGGDLLISSRLREW
jgi:diaminohydroxyphosphoribosylaminopyrimidine deaminase/5-amino-6-(5-phosphoribosylamino)uracil reductase